ncbi:MAG: thiolase family protein [Betaproteobacteria bacterium]|nr:thiolase family protein [Betaproteobacteria bacterium]
MNEVFVIGVGMTPSGKFLDRSVKDLTREAVGKAIADAGIAQADVSAAFFANATQSPMEGQHMVAGQVALGELGFARIPVMNVENACASGATAFHLACAYIRAGMSDVALAVGAEKMYSNDREKTFSVFNGAWDVHKVEEITANLVKLGEGVEPPAGRGGTGGERSIFMDVYAALAKQHMKTFGSTERQLAAVSAKNHGHSVHNPLSQYRKAMSIDDVLAARMIAWPLTLPMCAPISDGAAAAILVSREGLKRLAADQRGRAISVLATVVASGSTHGPAEYDKHICRTAAFAAYEQAGVGPGDISVAEVHDASAFAELLQSELLGFCEFGQGGWLAERGETSIGGRLPINPSGGLESKGHPIGATGLTQIVELVAQLRGEAGARQVDGARVALAENGGGFRGFEEAAASVTILARS